MFQLGSEENPGAKVLVERKVKIESDDHWVSVDTTSKTSFDDAWWGGVFKVQSLQDPVYTLHPHDHPAWMCAFGWSHFLMQASMQ